MNEALNPAALFGVSSLSAPLFGRERELSAMSEAARSVQNDKTMHVVTLLGPTGIGKSRILHEFLLDLRTQGNSQPRVYRGAARSDQQSHGLFARLLRTRFGVVEGMDVEAAKAQIRAQVAQVMGDRKVGDVCFFLGQFMQLPFQESPLTRAVMDDALQARLMRRAVVKSFIESDAASSPVCLLFEDLHQADDDSLELLRFLIENLSGQILVLCAARGDLLSRQEDWFDFGKPRHLRIELAPLESADATRVVEALLAPCEGGPPPALVESAVRMAAGNPGLLERMVRIFHDQGVLSERTLLGKETVWKVDLEKITSVRLPMSVDDAVASRIAALAPEERRVLEHAAAMGSVFWLGGVVSLGRIERRAPEFWTKASDADVAEVERTLEALVERDYVLKLPDSTFSDEVEYVFRNNLEREKITQLTSATAARRHHQLIADWLGQKEGVRSQEEYCAMLARHLEKAGSLTRAGLTYLEAGDIARSSFAAKKAHEYYARGLSLLGDADARRRIDALHNHGDVLVLLGRSDEALAAFREMLELAHRLGLRAKGGAAHNRIGRLHRETGSLSLGLTNLQTARELFESANDERGVAACRDDIGKLLWTKGEYKAALAEMKEGLEIRKRLGDRRSIALSLNNIGLVWMDHGKAKQAGEALEAALKIRREIGDLLGVVQSLNNLGKLAEDLNENARALERYREAYEVAKEIGERNRIAVVLTNMGETYHRIGQTEEAIRVLKQAEELCDELGDNLHLAEAKRGLAKAYLSQRDLRKAREAIKRAVDLFGQVRSKAHLATALRTLGEITAAGAWGAGHEGKAIDYFMRSIALCKEIGNELEVAKSYRAFSGYVKNSDHYKQNADIQREAQKLSDMADEIFERHRQLAAS